MKIFGHPLHVMLIHFPSALFPIELVFYGIYFFTGQLSFGQSAFYTMAGGVVFGWMAAIFGVADLIKIPAEKPTILKKALLHGSINITVVIVYTILAYSVYKVYPNIPVPKMALIIVKICAVGFMFIGNFMGGSLVLKDKVGIEK